jgi:hypothetical protein
MAQPKPSTPPTERPPKNERVIYQVSPGQFESATLITSGPNKGKYKDDKTGILYNDNIAWIRAKNSRIPTGGGAG